MGLLAEVQPLHRCNGHPTNYRHSAPVQGRALAALKDTLLEQAGISDRGRRYPSSRPLFSAFAVFEQKSDVTRKSEIASVIKMRYQTAGGDNLRLFVPFANPYVNHGTRLLP